MSKLNKNQFLNSGAKRIFPKVVLGIMLVVLGTISIVQAQEYELVVVYQENFDDPLSGWYAHDYTLMGDIYQNDTDPSSGLYIDDDGVLRATHKQGTHPEFVNRPSTVVYGNWSFDWTVNSSHSTRDVFMFVFTDRVTNHNYHGQSQEQILPGFTGYGLILDNDPGEVWLIRYPPLVNGTSPILGTYESPSVLTGSHHIEITRDMNGNISVFFDLVLRFSVIDTTHTISDVFCFGSFWGDSGFDNITVSEWQIVTTTTTTPTTTTTTTSDITTTTTTAPGIDFYIVFPIMISIALLSRRRK